MQVGFSMIEAMVAIVVLSFGLLAIAGFQVRVLAASAGANFGDQAARLADDMAERIRANPYAAAPPPPATVSFYAERGGWGAPSPNTPSPNCAAVACSTWEMALYDIWAWKTAVARTLPAGDATVVAGDGQLTLLVAWKDNAQFAAPLASVAGCPVDTGKSCHRLVVAIPVP